MNHFVCKMPEINVYVLFCLINCPKPKEKHIITVFDREKH